MQIESTRRSLLMSGGRYPVLRTIGILYLIGAAFTAVAGIVAFGWMMWSAPANPGDRISLGLGILAVAFFGVLAMLMIAEVIKLIIDVEHSARTCAMALALRAEQSLPLAADTVVAPSGNGAAVVTNRVAVFHDVNEETAEAALIRGH